MKSPKKTAPAQLPAAEKSINKHETPRDLDSAVAWFSVEFAALSTHSQRIKKAIELRKALLDRYETITVRSYLTRYRKAIKEQKPPRISEIFKSLKLPKADGEKIDNSYKNRIFKRLEDGGCFSLSRPNVDAILEKAKELLSGGQYKKLAGLALLTGRRTAEIALTGEFLPVEGNEFAALFSGQLKTKGKETKPYKIPLLAPFSEIKAAHESLKKQLDWSATATPDSANRRLSKELGLYAKEHFALLGENIAPHDLRKAYAAITFYQSGEKESYRVFAAKILGHSGNNTLTTETYTKYRVEG
jgi:hypothetical protein